MTVLSDNAGHSAVMVDWSPHGYEQISATWPKEDDYVDAKREAVQQAKAHGCEFKRPIQ